MAARRRKGRKAAPPPLPGNPTLAELLRQAIDSRLLDVHTALPGRVVTYDKAKQRATIELLVQHPAPTSEGDVFLETYAVLPNVPVGWLRGGGYSLQMPLKKGDTGLVIFSEASDAQWRVSGQVSDPGDLRRHDLSYGKFYPGIGPDSSPAEPLVTDDEARLDGPTLLRLGGSAADFVALAAKVDANFQKIIDLFSSWVVAPMDGGGALKTASATLSFDPTPTTKVKAE